MNDEIMLRQIAKKHANSDTVIVNELKVARGSARLDIAVLDDRINGFEIKAIMTRLLGYLLSYVITARSWIG